VRELARYSKVTAKIELNNSDNKGKKMTVSIIGNRWGGDIEKQLKCLRSLLYCSFLPI